MIDKIDSSLNLLGLNSDKIASIVNFLYVVLDPFSMKKFKTDNGYKGSLLKYLGIKLLVMGTEAELTSNSMVSSLNIKVTIGGSTSLSVKIT